MGVFHFDGRSGIKRGRGLGYGVGELTGTGLAHTKNCPGGSSSASAIQPFHQPGKALQVSATCICIRPMAHRGIDEIHQPTPVGHEYAGVVEAVGSAVTTIDPGQFVVGSFFASDKTCEICQAGYQGSCIQRRLVGAIGTQAELARIPRGRTPRRDP
jgi:hypothetical protein